MTTGIESICDYCSQPVPLEEVSTCAFCGMTTCNEHAEPEAHECEEVDEESR